jgi:arsenical pump membrane protein
MANPLLTGIIFALNCILLIFLIIKKPFFHVPFFGKKIHVESYAIAMAIAPIFLLVIGELNFAEMMRGINSPSSPINILILFLSMVFISIYLDSVGFLEYCARLSLRFAGRSGRKLFFALYATVSVLTIFTSNDIIILTLTPFIYYFTKHAKIDPKPFLIAEFFAANTWSMMLQIGNPTNIFITSAFKIGFLEYFRWMLLPSVIAGAANMLVIYLLFRKQIDRKILPSITRPMDAIKDKAGAITGVAILAVCIFFLSISQHIEIEMWKISLMCALALIIIIGIKDIFIMVSGKKEKSLLHESFSRMPCSIIPFVLSFFILIRALEVSGATMIFSEAINRNIGNPVTGIFAYGALSTVFSNLMNNIPMSVVFSSVLASLSGKTLFFSALATVIGSNLGANVTPVGALAGIMWMGILRHKKVSISFREFSYYGLIVTGITLFACLSTLAIEYILF